MNTLKQLKLGLVTLASIGMIAACGGGSSSGSSSSAVTNVTSKTTCPKGLDLVFGQHFASEEDRVRLASGMESVADVEDRIVAGLSQADPIVVVLKGDLARTAELENGQTAKLAMVVEENSEDSAESFVFAYVDDENTVVASIPLLVPYLTDYIVKSLDSQAYTDGLEEIESNTSQITPEQVIGYLEENSSRNAKDFILEKVYEKLLDSKVSIPWVYIVIDEEKNNTFSNIKLGNMKWNGAEEEKNQSKQYSKQIHKYYAHLLIDYNEHLEGFVDHATGLAGVSDDDTVGDTMDLILETLKSIYPDLAWEDTDQTVVEVVDSLDLNLDGLKGYTEYSNFVPQGLRSGLNSASRITGNWLKAVEQYQGNIPYENDQEIEYIAVVLSSAVDAFDMAEIMLKGLSSGSISLNGYGIDDACMALITDTVDFDIMGGAVTSLDLRNNELGPDGLRAILNHFDKRDANGNRMHGLSISSIDISGNQKITRQDVNNLIEEFPNILDGVFSASITIYSDGSLGDTTEVAK